MKTGFYFAPVYEYKTIDGCGFIGMLYWRGLSGAWSVFSQKMDMAKVRSARVYPREG